MVVQSNCSLLHNTLLKTLTPPRQCLLFSGIFQNIKILDSKNNNKTNLYDFFSY